MNFLVVSSYPPMRCGIGRYAEQQVAALRAAGHRVDVLSPPEGEGDWHAELQGGLRPLRLLWLAWAYEEIIIHYTPHFFYGERSRAGRILTSLAFLLVLLLSRGRVVFLIHETSYRLEQAQCGSRHRIDRWYFRLARRVEFHSKREREVFMDFYRLHGAADRLQVVPHERHMAPRCTLNRAEARRALGLPVEAVLLVCLGFIQPHKGFDRVLEVFARVPGEHLRLKIVGSVRLNWDVAHAYATELHRLAERDPRCEVIECFPDDETFDTWIVASDYVVAPYREIWSSSVAARAKLFGRPMIATETGGLREQLTEGSFTFGSDLELAEILARIPPTATGAASGPDTTEVTLEPA